MLVLTALSGFGGRRRVSGGGSGVTLTLADIGSGFYGFFTASAPNNFTPGTPIGSLSGEPVAGQTMAEFLVGTMGSWVAFVGNVPGALSGKSVWLNGVNYPFDAADWYYYGADGHTYGEWAVGGPAATPGTYSLEIK